MKKSLIVLIVLLFASVACADWSVTVTWTPSAGPNLASEKVLLDTVEKCEVIVADPASCNFVVTTLNNQEVSIVSYNDQGTASTPYVVGNLLATPAPASGGVITITIVP